MTGNGLFIPPIKMVMTQTQIALFYPHGGFLKWGYPQIIHLKIGFPIKKTFQLLGIPHLWKTPYLYIYNSQSWVLYGIVLPASIILVITIH